MVFQHFRFLAPPSPHIYPSHLPSKASRLIFCFRSKKRIKNYGFFNHFAFQSINSSPSKPSKKDYFWWCMSVTSLCFSIASALVSPMPPKLELKIRRKNVYYLYRWLPWATFVTYLLSFWHHFDVSVASLMLFLRNGHQFWCIFHSPHTFFKKTYKN